MLNPPNETPSSVRASRDSVAAPLTAQTYSLLSITPPASTHPRERRLSDTAMPQSADYAKQMRSLAVRSKDGSRWLPVPDEQSHTVRSNELNCSTPTTSIASIAELQPHICSTAQCSVDRVFKTTELLELILNSLDTIDVLRVRLVHSRWNTIVEHSPQLRLHMFCVPQWRRRGEDLKILPLVLPGLSIELGQPIRLGQWVKVVFTLEAACHIAPQLSPCRRPRSRSIYEGLRGGLGSTAQRENDSWPVIAPSTEHTSTFYQNLFVTQPPIVGMQAFLVYPSTDNSRDTSTDIEEAVADDNLPSCAKVNCNAGIKLGFLAETAREILCSQKDGSSNHTDVKVMFNGILSFVTPEELPRKRDQARRVHRF